jgi:hypothetical protein
VEVIAGVLLSDFWKVRLKERLNLYFSYCLLDRRRLLASSSFDFVVWNLEAGHKKFT